MNPKHSGPLICCDKNFVHSMEKIKDKRVLITGASGGIGRQTALQLAASGAHLFLSGRNRERLLETAQLARVPEERCFVLDLDHTIGIGKMGQTIHETGPLDILINAAGIGIIKPMEQLSVEEFSKTLSINLVAPFLLMKTRTEERSVGEECSS